MRVSEYYGLNKTQPELDFLDVDVDRDIKLFIDPVALSLSKSDLAMECSALVQDYFGLLLETVNENKRTRGIRMMSRLSEPNETHLGLSANQSEGRGLGPVTAAAFWDALRDSDARSSGLIKDIQDTAVLVENIGPDIVSDITTNIIRGPLLRYTEEMSNLYGIQLFDDISSGFVWDAETGQWTQYYTRRPMANGRPILLVPKIFVRKRHSYQVDEYYRWCVLDYLADVEMSSTQKSSLVQRRKNGDPYVNKKDLRAKYGEGKPKAIKYTIATPSIYDDYKRKKQQKPLEAMPHEDIASAIDDDVPDYDELYAKLASIDPGRNEASAYEDAILGLLSALFYPALSEPECQVNLNQGRKRVDITFMNTASPSTDFFNWVRNEHPAGRILIECKNYSSDISNPEIDQLVGRFSDLRGKVGIIVSRRSDNKNAILQRCRDAALHRQGFVIYLDDEDLKTLVDERKQEETCTSLHGLLRRRYDELVL